PILDAIKLYLPSPKGNSRLGTQLILRPKNEVWAIDDAPLVAFVFKVVVDNLKGVMVFVRIYSGTLQAKATVVNSSISKRSKLVKERVNKIMTIYADYSEEISELKAGNIGVLLGMKHTKTGDTLLDLNHPSIVSGSPEKLSHENPKSTERKLKNINANHSSREVVGVSEKMDNQNAEDGWDVLGGLEKDLVPGENALTHNSTNDDLLQLHKIRIPPPVFFCQIEPDSISDEKHLINVLNNLVLQDPSLNYFRDIEGGDQIVLTGMGELHLEVTLSRLLQEKVKAQMGRVRISYRESISAKYELLNYQMEKTVSTGTSTGTSNTLGNKPISIGFDVCVEPVYSDFIENVTNDSKVIHLGGNNFLDLSQLNLKNSQTPAQGTHTQGNGKCSSDFQAVKDTIASSVEVSMYQGPTLGYILNNVKTTISNLSLPQNLLAELQQQHSQSPQKTSILSILRMAIIQALKQAISGANPVLLQPVMNVSISTTPEYLGPILSMLETFKSTKIISISSNEDSLLHTGQDENAGGCDGSGSLSKALLDLITVGHNDNSTAYNNHSSTDGGQNSSGINEILAIIPLYNLIGFSSTLRKLTAGTASFSMQLNGFDRVEELAKGHILKELRGF
ncbi:Ribosome-releasing factor 2, mitochondrial, partial [Zancudomyces culisetae]